ncbi:MAG TPA: adenine phosphoribosyltransferase [Candidatus Thermoplasmatota archaeon]|nr:adenine phosphoribosyltransferase [Candidatus Thermoplasmatota archaeon]
MTPATRSARKKAATPPRRARPVKPRPAVPAPRNPPTRSPRQPAPAPAPSPAERALDESLASALVLDRAGYSYIVHPLLDGVPRCPPELLEAWLSWARRQDPAGEATLLLAPEAMGLPLVAPLSLALGIPYGIVRKRKYGLAGEQVAYAETGYGEAALHINDVGPGDKVLVVDDVLSTGGTLGSILATLQHMGVTVVGALVAIDKGHRRAMLEDRFGVPIHAMRAIRVEAGKVRVLSRPAG